VQAPAPRPIGVDPTGRLATGDRNNPYFAAMQECDRDRILLAELDSERRFRDILDEANRSNASFYPIEPRGLPVFDADIGPNPPPPVTVDFQNLRNRQDTLYTLAAATDGTAVINSNDIDAGLKRVVADLSSYYLLSYSSTNSRLDGRFRAIKVRVTRPGVAPAVASASVG
jgi:VWFA-related protein